MAQKLSSRQSDRNNQLANITPDAHNNYIATHKLESNMTHNISLSDAEFFIETLQILGDGTQASSLAEVKIIHSQMDRLIEGALYVVQFARTNRKPENFESVIQGALDACAEIERNVTPE